MNLGLWGSISPKTILEAVARGVAGESSYSISGTVYDADGSTAVAGATVALGLLTATSAANGTYTIASVPPGTSGSMTCTKAGYSWTAITVAEMTDNLTSQNYTNAWWAATGISASCVRAYRAIGAANIGASYVNLVSPGTGDATTSAAPTFAAATGWTFNGSTQFLDTGYTGTNSLSGVIRISNGVAGNKGCFGATNAAASNMRFVIYPHLAANSASFRAGGTYTTDVGTNYDAGVLGVTPVKGYANGAPVGNLATPWTSTGTQTVYIGGHNTSSGVEYWTGKAQAFAIYAATLNDAQMAAVSAAMAALTNP